MYLYPNRTIRVDIRTLGFLNESIWHLLIDRYVWGGTGEIRRNDLMETVEHISH